MRNYLIRLNGRTYAEQIQNINYFFCYCNDLQPYCTRYEIELHSMRNKNFLYYSGTITISLIFTDCFEYEINLTKLYAMWYIVHRVNANYA